MLLDLHHVVGVPGGYVGTSEAGIYDSVDGVVWRSRKIAGPLGTILATREAVYVFVENPGEVAVFRGPRDVRL